MEKQKVRHLSCSKQIDYKEILSKTSFSHCYDQISMGSHSREMGLTKRYKHNLFMEVGVILT